MLFFVIVIITIRKHSVLCVRKLLQCFAPLGYQILLNLNENENRKSIHNTLSHHSVIACVDFVCTEASKYNGFRRTVSRLMMQLERERGNCLLSCQTPLTDSSWVSRIPCQGNKHGEVRKV